jgi:hypothetical protein
VRAVVIGCALLCATGVVAHPQQARAADEAITSPTQGQEIPLNTDITITFTGEPNSEYTITIVKLLSTIGYPHDVDTMSEGEGSLDTNTGLYGGAGDYVIEIRAGHGNTSGSALDTVGFTITPE